MEPRSYTAIRNHLAEALDQVNDDRVPTLITRQKGRPAVLMSLEEYGELVSDTPNLTNLNRPRWNISGTAEYPAACR